MCLVKDIWGRRGGKGESGELQKSSMSSIESEVKKGGPGWDIRREVEFGNNC